MLHPAETTLSPASTASTAMGHAATTLRQATSATSAAATSTAALLRTNRRDNAGKANEQGCAGRQQNAFHRVSP
jgi:hypothetical protein